MQYAASKDWQVYQSLRQSSVVEDNTVRPVGMSDEEELLRMYGSAAPVGEILVEQNYEDYVELGLINE